MARHQPSPIRREQILTAALSVCAEKGYHATRIDDIAAAAGLSKGAVYHHFDSKDDVFVGVMAQMMGEVGEVFRALDQQGNRPAEILRQLVAYFVQAIRDEPQLMRAMIDLYLLGARHRAFRERFDQHYQVLLTMCEEVIQRGIDTGEFAAEIDAARVARVFCMGGDGIMMLHLVADEVELGCQSLTDMCELILRGIAVQKGELR